MSKVRSLLIKAVAATLIVGILFVVSQRCVISLDDVTATNSPSSAITKFTAVTPSKTRMVASSLPPYVQIHTCESTYYEFVSMLLQEDLGDVVLNAIYDPEMLNSMARDPVESDADRAFVWRINRLREPPVPPAPFSSPAGILRMTKRWLSVGIARVHRDGDMQRMYKRWCSNEGEGASRFAVFKRAMQRVTQSYTSYAFTLFQLAIDALTDTQKRAMKAKQTATTLDPILRVVAKITYRSTLAEVESLLNAEISATTASDAQFTIERKLVHALFPLEYTKLHFDGQKPSNGKFWNMLRPTATCSSLVRMCELADGCRLLCNAPYLIRAGLSLESAGVPVAHRLVGFGSNNEYDWELSLNNLFLSAGSVVPQHSIGSFSVFDCTLTSSGNRKWTPPAELVDGKIGFGYASKCLDGVASDTSITLGDLKDLLQKTEGGATTSITRTSLNPLSQETQQAARARRWGDVRVFDGISILKVDVEGYEFNALPAWGRDELQNLAATSPEAVAEHSKSPIDMEISIPKYWSVSLLSMEFHRMGHKGNYAATLRGALRTHFTMLHLYGLGFLMVGQERNHQDNCCFELAWAHYRHYVRSEMWMIFEIGRAHV